MSFATPAIWPPAYSTRRGASAIRRQAILDRWRIPARLSLIGFTFVLGSCASIPALGPDTVATASHRDHPPAVGTAGSAIPRDQEDALRAAVVSNARALLGRKPEERVMVRGREYILDCTGTISAAWWGAGYDIQRDFSRYKGNGVSRLYRSVEAWGALHQLKVPKPGDIIFWSNTYDRNGNGVRYDDGLTHAGLVILVEDDGTVHYLHESYSRGVVIAYFNLLHPDEARSPEGKVWNSPMYLGSNYGKATNPPHWLSGDLWTAFGDAMRTAMVLKAD